MNSIALFWLGIGIVFLIIEMIAPMFYGLSLALSAFAVSVYAWVMAVQALDLSQGIIFAIISVILAYVFPRWLSPKSEEKPQGLDLYIGETRRIKAVGEDWKITLDGVDYIVIVDEEADEGDRVEITDRKGSVFYAKKV